MSRKPNTCPLSRNENKCSAFECSCGEISAQLCRALFRAYCFGCIEATARINAKKQREEAEKAAKLLGTAKITILDACPVIETNPVPLVTKNTANFKQT